MQTLAGLILVGIIISLFYFISKKIGAFEGKDNNSDDFSCH